MARSAGEVQAEIALIRQGIERELDALHRRVPQRWWIAYVWMGGGMALGLLLSRYPLAPLVAGALRLTQLGLGAIATVTTVQKVMADVAELRRGRSAPSGAGDGGLREDLNPNQARTAA